VSTAPVANPLASGWDLHDVLARIRRESPVVEITLPTGTTAWLVTRYDDAQRALGDPRLSKAAKPAGGVNVRTLVPEEVERALNRHMLSADPPDHTRLRRLVSGPFAPRRVAAMRPWIEQIADRLLDDLAATAAGTGAATVDLLDAYAAPLPIEVICELLGIPAEDRSAFRGWVNAVLAGPMDVAGWVPAVLALLDHVRGLLADKRRHPGDDLLTALLTVRDQGDRLTDDELTSMVYLLLLAGHETTTNLIANGVLLLLSEPARWARVVAEPELLPGVVEECLRYEGPVQTATFRTAVVPVELGGQLIPAGAVVLVSLAAANRDPDRFPDPDRLLLDRPAVPNLAFGHGVHYCLGAPLARLEGQVAFGALARRFPGMRLAVPVEQLAWRPSVLIRGLSALPVTLAGARQTDGGRRTSGPSRTPPVTGALTYPASAFRAVLLDGPLDGPVDLAEPERVGGADQHDLPAAVLHPEFLDPDALLVGAVQPGQRQLQERHEREGPDRAGGQDHRGEPPLVPLVGGVGERQHTDHRDQRRNREEEDQHAPAEQPGPGPGGAGAAGVPDVGHLGDRHHVPVRLDDVGGDPHRVVPVIERHHSSKARPSTVAATCRVGPGHPTGWTVGVVSGGHCPSCAARPPAAGHGRSGRTVTRRRCGAAAPACPATAPRSPGGGCPGRSCGRSGRAEGR